MYSRRAPRFPAFCALVFVLPFSCSRLAAQSPGGAPSTGDLTIRLEQGLDSAQNPRGVSEGLVLQSTNPAVPKGTAALMRLVADPASGGFTVQLVQLILSGQNLPAASSAVTPAPDFFNKTQERLRDPRAPHDAAAGPRVFLPERMVVRFTLAAPAAEAARANAPARTASQPAAPMPATWRIQPTEQNGQQASIVGVAQVGNRRGRALFDMKCTVSPPANGATHASGYAISEVRIPRGLVTFPTDPLDCGASLGNDFARLTLGSGAETKTGFCLNTALPTDPRQDAVFEVGSPSRALVNAPGVPLVLALRLPDTQSDAFTARFDLPQDGSAVASTMNPCLDLMEQQQERTKAAIVAACPDHPGMTLRKVNVLSGPSMKILESADDDSGSSWDFSQKPARGVAAPKKTLACFYGPGTGILDEHKEHLEKKLVPIPSTAIACSFSGDSATCSKAEAN